ncbi:MAG TPA: hypothetical protein VJ623_10880 [Holophagaceae bacterium]|nr:hypothetical protein [Holophagaceae bacterium]
MRRCLPLALLSASLMAQGSGTQLPPGGIRPGVALLVASGLGDMSHDLNNHPGLGFRISVHVPVTPQLELRPAFEWTGYRVSDYNLAARAASSGLGLDYQETRTVFRTYRLGADAVLFLREPQRGPFLSLGVGVQRSQVYLEDRAVDSSGTEVSTLDTGDRKTGLWLGAGLGYQWRQANLEVRLSEAPYRYTPARSASGAEAPFDGRQGYALHLIWGVRF